MMLDIMIVLYDYINQFYVHVWKIDYG
jgi:hypothetical protein